MVEVFKTNVSDESQAEKLLEILAWHFPACRINFDLDDCDKILRIEGEGLFTASVQMIVAENGFTCEILG